MTGQGDCAGKRIVGESAWGQATWGGAASWCSPGDCRREGCLVPCFPHCWAPGNARQCHFHLAGSAANILVSGRGNKETLAPHLGMSCMSVNVSLVGSAYTVCHLQCKASYQHVKVKR